MISKERGTRLEGSFRTDKEHFLLKKEKHETKRPKSYGYFLEFIPLMHSKLDKESKNRPKK